MVAAAKTLMALPGPECGSGGSTGSRESHTKYNRSVAAIGVYLMTAIRHREEELKKLVIKDNLTALYNRAYFFYQLNSEIQRW